MPKLKEAEVRRQLLSILPDHFETEGHCHIRVRIYEIDKLADYILAAYDLGYHDGKNRTKGKCINALRNL